jgi:hypothetical protein
VPESECKTPTLIVSAAIAMLADKLKAATLATVPPVFNHCFTFTFISNSKLYAFIKMIFYDPDAQPVCANNGVTKGREQKLCQKRKNSLPSPFIKARHYIIKSKYNTLLCPSCTN